MKECEYCHKEVKDKSNRAKFCNDICRASFHQKKRIENGDELILVKSERIKFVQILNPRIKNAKQLLDFLYEEYCKLYKVEKKSIFIAEPKDEYNPPPKGRSDENEPINGQETDNLQDWKTQINNCENIEELNYIGQKISASGLSRWDQNILNKHGKLTCERKGFI